jgi:hypothetical protein
VFLTYKVRIFSIHVPSCCHASMAGPVTAAVGQRCCAAMHKICCCAGFISTACR